MERVWWLQMSSYFC